MLFTKSSERGFTVLLRVLLGIVLAAVCAGCAKNAFGPPSHFMETGALSVPAPAGDLDSAAFAEKSLAARVLAALALERSTGRTPDPARLDDLN